MSGIRYSDGEKAKVIDFVKSWDAQHGRGGKLQAVKKFKVAPLTLRSWLKDAQTSEPSRPAAPASEKKAVKKITAKTSGQAVNTGLKGKITSHIERIESYSSQIADLQAKIVKEKEAIQREIE